MIMMRVLPLALIAVALVASISSVYGAGIAVGLSKPAASAGGVGNGDGSVPLINYLDAQVCGCWSFAVCSTCSTGPSTLDCEDIDCCDMHAWSNALSIR